MSWEEPLTITKETYHSPGSSNCYKIEYVLERFGDIDPIGAAAFYAEKVADHWILSKRADPMRGEKFNSTALNWERVPFDVRHEFREAEALLEIEAEAYAAKLSRDSKQKREPSDETIFPIIRIGYALPTN
jgi:hypothetical protein